MKVAAIESAPQGADAADQAITLIRLLQSRRWPEWQAFDLLSDITKLVRKTVDAVTIIPDAAAALAADDRRREILLRNSRGPGVVESDKEGTV